MLVPSQKIENPNFYLAMALRKASQDLSRQHFTIPVYKNAKRKTNLRIRKQKLLEQTRLKLLKTHLNAVLETMIKGYPNLDDLNEFYIQLTQTTLDVVKLKKGLAAVQWAQGQIGTLVRMHSSRMGASTEAEDPKRFTQMCLGRIKSVLKRIPFDYLEESRLVIRGYPTIKEMYTLSIAGFPNVGKSTLLSRLTTAKPEIKDYAFTTKQLNVGYYTHHPYTIQIIDTPGTLNRFEKMNPIEQQAYLAMKYASDVILYVYDLTETSYPLSAQEKLHERLLELDKPILLYLSKVDLLDEAVIAPFLKKYPHAAITADQVKKEILVHAKQH